MSTPLIFFSKQEAGEMERRETLAVCRWSSLCHQSGSWWTAHKFPHQKTSWDLLLSPGARPMKINNQLRPLIRCDPIAVCLYLWSYASAGVFARLRVMGSTAGWWRIIKPAEGHWWAKHTVDSQEQQDNHYSSTPCFVNMSDSYNNAAISALKLQLHESNNSRLVGFIQNSPIWHECFCSWVTSILTQTGSSLQSLILRRNTEGVSSVFIFPEKCGTRQKKNRKKN